VTPLTYEVLDIYTGLSVPEVVVSGTSLVISSTDPYMKGTKSYNIKATAATSPYIIGTTGTSRLDVFYQLCE